MIEKVILKRHLKCGDKEFGVGTYTDPIPQEILSESRRGDLVEIVYSQPSPAPTVVLEAKKVSVWAKEPEDPGPETPAMKVVPKKQKEEPKKEATKKPPPVRKPRKLN